MILVRWSTDFSSSVIFEIFRLGFVRELRRSTAKFFQLVDFFTTGYGLMYVGFSWRISWTGLLSEDKAFRLRVSNSTDRFFVIAMLRTSSLCLSWFGWKIGVVSAVTELPFWFMCEYRIRPAAFEVWLNRAGCFEFMSPAMIVGKVVSSSLSIS